MREKSSTFIFICVCWLQLWSGDLCWRKHKLLVGPPMPDRSKGRGQTKCSLWSFGVGVRCGANEPSTEKCTVAKPPEENRGGGQDAHRVVAPVKKKKLTAVTFSESTYIKSRWLTGSPKLCECIAVFQITLQNTMTSSTVTASNGIATHSLINHVIGYQHLLAFYRYSIPPFPSIQVPKNSEQRCQMLTTSVRQRQSLPYCHIIYMTMK
jgi:hypothetical protein